MSVKGSLQSAEEGRQLSESNRMIHTATLTFVDEQCTITGDYGMEDEFEEEFALVMGTCS